MSIRAVFDTNTIISALLFASGRLSWLRTSWQKGTSIPVVSKQTTQELLRVLTYPKFKLSGQEQQELLSEFLPFAEIGLVAANQPYDYPACRDKQDEKFLSLMVAANASFLVTGDADLLVLNDQVTFNIIKPMAFKTYLD